MSNDPSQKPREEDTEFAVVDKWLQRLLAWASVPALILAVIFNRTYLVILCGLWLVAAFGYFFIKKSRGEKPLGLGIGEALNEMPAARVGRLIDTPVAKEQEKLAPIDTHQILKALEEEYEIRKLEPNLIRLDTEDVPAHNDENGVIVVGKADGTETFRVKVAPYQNRASNRRVATINDVSARISYGHVGGNPLFTIHRGAWLSEKESKVDFERNGPPRRLIVATVEEADKPHVFAIRRDFDSDYKGALTKREELYGDLFSVIVELFAESGSNAIKKFEYILEVIREPEFKVELISALVWKLRHLSEFYSQGHEFLMKLYEISTEAHEKGKAIGDFFNEEILAAKKRQEEEVAEQVKEWEARAVSFIGLLYGEQQKDGFLKSTPTIDEGLREEKKHWTHRLRLGDENKKGFVSYQWTLIDSIKVRVKELDRFMSTLLRQA